MPSLVMLAACSDVPADGPAVADEAEAGVAGHRPQRIVSLDYCADQYVLELADRAQVMAVSPDAGKSFSYMRTAAEGFMTVRPVAEDILILKPDLVVRSYGGGPGAANFFKRAGIPVLQLNPVSSIHGEAPDSVVGVMREVAAGLGQPERGEVLIGQYHERLRQLQDAITPEPGAEPSALYMASGGATTGPGTLIHEMLRAAGLDNFQQQPGWQSLPLERLAYERPDLMVEAVFNKAVTASSSWSAARHPLVRNRFDEQDSTSLDGAWTSCGGWFIMDAVEALATARPVLPGAQP